MGLDLEVQYVSEGPRRTDPVDDYVPLQRQRLVRGRPPRERRESVRRLLAETKHAKLLLKTDQQVAHKVLCP